MKHDPAAITHVKNGYHLRMIDTENNPAALNTRVQSEHQVFAFPFHKRIDAPNKRFVRLICVASAVISGPCEVTLWCAATVPSRSSDQRPGLSEGSIPRTRLDFATRWTGRPRDKRK